MEATDMKRRTKLFALGVIRTVQGLPRTVETNVIAKQLVRCGTSVGANYRSACLARSRADFASKLGVVAEEADEALYWMELLIEGGVCRIENLRPLMQEARELTSILIASIKTVKANQPRY